VHRHCRLAVERCELSPLPDAAWKDYEHDGNEQALVRRHVGFFRSIFVPSLATGLRDSGKRQMFADEFSCGLTRRLSNHPEAYHSFTQTIVLAKYDRSRADKKLCWDGSALACAQADAV
jgi:hypothetical protein